MMSLMIRSSLILCLFALPSFADDRLPLQEGRYNAKGISCEANVNENTALLRNQTISITAIQCEFFEPKLIGDGEYSLIAKCAQPELRAEFLNEAQLKIIADDAFQLDDGLELRSYRLCSQ